MHLKSFLFSSLGALPWLAFGQDTTTQTPPDIEAETIEDASGTPTLQESGGSAPSGREASQENGFPFQTTSQVFTPAHRSAGWRAGFGASVGRLFLSKKLSDVIGNAPSFGIAVSSPIRVTSENTTLVLDFRARYTHFKKSWTPPPHNTVSLGVGRNAKAAAQFVDVDLLVAFEYVLNSRFRIVPALGPAIHYRRLGIDADSSRHPELNKTGVVGGFHARVDLLAHSTFGALQTWAAPGIGFSAGAQQRISLTSVGGTSVDLNSPRADVQCGLGLRF